MLCVIIINNILIIFIFFPFLTMIKNTRPGPKSTFWHVFGGLISLAISEPRR